MLREQLDRLWTYKTRPGVLNFLMGWFKALRWQRLPEMEQLGDFLLRRARGMRDEEVLLLKLKWATARPIRSARDLAGFLSVQPAYSNQ